MTPVTTTALDRSDILDMMGSLKLFGMRSAFDEVISTAVKRQYERNASSKGYVYARFSRPLGAGGATERR